MRFFKAFNLLHRRAKSETFIPGYIPPNFAVSHLNCRPSSLPADLGSNKQDISSIFDFSPAGFTPVSANFNHLRGIHHAVTTSRTQAGNSQNLSSLLVEENMRLRDSLNLWFSEYSGADKLLQECRAELAFERAKNQTLEQQTAHDQELIMDLKKDISRYEKRFEYSRDPAFTSHCGWCSPDQSNPANDSRHTLLLPGSSDSATSLVISKKIRTLDEYTSALRMTLSTRRLLRNQKKVSKFWKNMALSAGNCEDIITPSTSAISSVHDSLPPERKRAINALMQERGWPYPRVESAEPKSQVDHGSSEPPPNASPSGDLSLSHIHPVSSIAATLLSTSSNNSVGSRLAPLASESLKVEMNLLFGIQAAPSKKYRPASVLSSTAPKTMVESPPGFNNILKANSLAFSFGSFGDLSQRFSNLFSQDHAPRVKLPGAKDDLIQNPEPITGSRRSPLPPSSCLAESSAPSGSSRIFGEALALLQGQLDTDMCLNLQPDIDKEEIKPLKVGGSWRNYIVPAPTQIPSKIRLRKRNFAGKENVVPFSKSSSIFQNPKSSLAKD